MQKLEGGGFQFFPQSVNRWAGGSLSIDHTCAGFLSNIAHFRLRFEVQFSRSRTAICVRKPFSISHSLHLWIIMIRLPRRHPRLHIMCGAISLRSCSVPADCHPRHVGIGALRRNPMVFLECNRFARSFTDVGRRWLSLSRCPIHIWLTSHLRPTISLSQRRTVEGPVQSLLFREWLMRSWARVVSLISKICLHRSRIELWI